MRREQTSRRRTKQAHLGGAAAEEVSRSASLHEWIGGAAAEEVSRSVSLHEWIGETVVLWAAKADPDFLGVCRCFFWYLH